MSLRPRWTVDDNVQLKAQFEDVTSTNGQAIIDRAASILGRSPTAIRHQAKKLNLFPIFGINTEDVVVNIEEISQATNVVVDGDKISVINGTVTLNGKVITGTFVIE